MRHTQRLGRMRHLKQMHRVAHNRRGCYFRYREYVTAQGRLPCVLLSNQPGSGKQD